MGTIRLKDNPESATRTAHSVAAVDSVRCEVQMDQHSIVIDEPPERGGDDTGASPLYHLAASLASCQTVQVVKVAQAMRLDIGPVKIDATIDTGKGEGREKSALILRIVGAKMVISINSDASEAKIERLKQLSLDRCPIGALLEDAGVVPEIVWNIEQQ